MMQEQQAEQILKERTEILETDKWNVEALYPTLKAWEIDFKEIARPDKSPHWPELEAYKGKLSQGAPTLKKFLDLSGDIDRKLSKLYTYAHLRFDEDLGNDEHKKANKKITAILYDFQQELSWVEPEILSLPDHTIQAYLNDPVLKEYRFHLERIVRLKPHILSSDKEELLAIAGKAMGAPSKAFSALNNADLKFAKIKDGKGNLLELTHARYSLYLRSKDRVLRKNAFDSIYASYTGFENTLCELINGQVQNHIFNKEVRHYPTSLDAALFPNQIDPKVYTTLIDTVRKHLPVLHKYMKLRKHALKVDELHMYDLHVPLVEDVDLRFSYDEAEDMVVASVAPLGETYQNELGEGLKNGRWVDRYENQRKRSGAYSSGCYDSMPYILMNYQGTFNDMMTLAHEAGHSMHSFYSHKSQPYQYSSYPIFVAEVASTFNEEMMFYYMMSQDLPEKEKQFLINQKIEDIRNTFFRQTMFAEFELWIHQQAEADIPITPALLKEHYAQLNRDYFGPDVVVDPEIAVEWARIPHFYYNFYVYQYATGISAAHALVEKVMQGDEAARKAYLQFLSSGSRHYPLELLKMAGVDMRQAAPMEATIKHFEHLVDQLFVLLK